MYELKKIIGKILTSKSVGTGPSSYEKKNLPCHGLTKVEKHCCVIQFDLLMMRTAVPETCRGL